MSKFTLKDVENIVENRFDDDQDLVTVILELIKFEFDSGASVDDNIHAIQGVLEGLRARLEQLEDDFTNVEDELFDDHFDA